MAISQLPRLAPSLIGRPNLIDQLNAAAAVGAVWVSAPAGAGKTTAVVQWLKAKRKSAAWLRIDPSDNDPGVLLPSIAGSFAPFLRESPEGIAYGPEHRAQLARFARYFFRQLFANLKRVVTWVIDNAQDTDADTLETLIAAAIEEAPANLTIFVISRSEPSERLARQIVHRQLVLVGRDSLKFSVDDTTALFAKLALPSSTDLAARYCRELDGWAVGLVLASDALRHSTTESEHVPLRSLEAPALANYLAAGVFDRLSSTQKTVLLSTINCAKFTVANAVRLSGVADCHAALDALHRHSGFVEIDDTAEPHYAVHPVFRSYLQRRILSEYSSAQIAALQRASADLLLETEQYAAAASLLRTLGDDDALASIVEMQAPALLQDGLDQTVVELVHAMSPNSAARDRPWVRFWHAEALALVSPAQANAEASAARRAFDASGDSLGSILAAGTLLSLHRTVRLDIPDPIVIAERCEMLFQQRWSQSSDTNALDIFAAAAYLSAISTLNRGTEIPDEICEWLLGVLRQEGSPNSRLRLATVLYEQFYIRNDLVRARSVEVQAAEICKLPECRAVARRTWYVGLAIGRIYQRRLEEARPALDTAAKLATELSDLESLCHVNAWRIVLACRLRRPSDGLAWTLSATPEFAEVAPLIRANMLWAEGNLYVALRQFETALQRFDAAVQLYHETNTNVEQGPMIWLGQSICHLMLGRYESALASLAPLVASNIGGTARQRLSAFTGAIRAAVAIARNEADVDQHVKSALALIHETDYRDVMHGAEPMLAALCAHALRINADKEFVDTLIRHRQLDAPSDAPSEWPFPVRIRALGELQIETRTPDAHERTMRKSIELLHQVLAALPDPAPIDPIIAKLWPGDGREGAQKAFDAALHRLRKRLGSESALRLSEKRLTFGKTHVYLDCAALIDYLNIVDNSSPAHVENCFSLYSDHLLPGVSDPAIVAQRARVWRKFAQAMTQAITEAKARGELTKAAEWQSKLDALASTAP